MGKRGRSAELIEKRNKDLIQRYWYWTEDQRLRFDDTLKVLEGEFYITAERIKAIIREFCKANPEAKVTPVPKVRKPRLNKQQLSLILGEEPQNCL